MADNWAAEAWEVYGVLPAPKVRRDAVAKIARKRRLRAALARRRAKRTRRFSNG